MRTTNRLYAIGERDLLLAFGAVLDMLSDVSRIDQGDDSDHQLVIDADLSEFIFYDGNATAMVPGEDVIEQGGLAGAQETGHDGYRDASIG
jgi:hypothetical protein